ncbi:sensor histidine kinase [Aquisalinus flavus]|uniref:histidine kinase n=1 Tax=Aquisalinus flavus TaxID=1526572 RepID=A0A8J2Y763_9PROT|nr:HAMP domain-containing sensor histidine kinase [Aquisalinus flavus]MBD0427038.1 HAMP domain-containing histidine kinase [Aquisalinus flavus]UNE46864.1 HAMP domain-containing histidine kinase [Aquisalinus flavus]GGC97895.1 hypothetical protein GCM10011342_03520 [Aquisalinus flavus]
MTVETQKKNRLTAKFQDPHLEHAYQEYSRTYFTGKDRVMFYVAILVYLLYVILDYFTLQNARTEVIGLRIALSLGALAVIGLTYLDFGKKHIQYLCCGLMATGGVSISYMVWLEGSVSPPYYVGLIMTAMILNNLVRISFLLSFGVLLLSYFSFIFAVAGIPYGRDVFAAHFFILNAFMLSSIAIYFLEIARRDEYMKFLLNQQYAQKLQYMFEDANRSIKRKNAVLNTLTHIFKTPLHQIIGYAQILEQESLGQHEATEYKEFSSNIHAAGQGLLRTVQRILTYSRLDSGSIKLSRQSTTTAELIDCALSRLVDEMEARNLVLEKPDRHFRIKVDGALMEQAVYELLANAVEASPDKGIIKISTEEAEDVVSIVITDQGTGIDLDKLDEIENTLERTEEFLGVSDKISLGITLTSRIVQTHSGRISFAHAEDGGTIATLTLDRTENEAALKPPAGEPGTAAQDKGLRRAS